MAGRSPLLPRALVTTLLLAVLGGLLLPVADAAPDPDRGPRTMVALGDSYAAGPLVPVQVEQPWGCLRSSLNYAHQVADALALELTDVTCSGASTKHMWETHGVSPEDEFAEYGAPLGYDGHPGNPPQLDALRADTDVVTLQIGGNDIGFGGIASTCAEAAVTQTSCKGAVEAERPFDRIAATAPKIAAVLEEIHRRSPDADVHVLGYPGIFAIGPTAGCPAMGVDEDDARYLRSIQEALNDMIRSVADDPGRSYSDVTGYVDVYAPSAGHTACDLPAVRWVEPLVPVNAAAPVHPNLGGMTAIRDLLLDEVWPDGLPRRTAPPSLPPPPDSPL
ncbi:MAG TPA: SGNH/GDSL hydrolase family protein [Acidimicrobiales bacterium]|nr:SGNH/GDSL hydrolase family protein [Acidimicrobiales bacterium]